MSILVLVLRTSRRVVILSVIAGVIGGAVSMALIGLIHSGLVHTGPPSPALALSFAALCLIAMASRVAAQAAMIRLGQGAVTKLLVLLCRKILALPLCQFERADPDGLLAVLTEDVVIVAGAIVGIPLLCINLPIVVACLAYAGWLSPSILAFGAGFAALAIGAYLALAAGGVRQLRAARAGQDLLVSQFRALIDGFRELKQHTTRREAFLVEGLEPAAATVRDRTSAGLQIFALAEGWCGLAFFGFLGFLLFLLPALRDIDRQALAGGVLIVLYIMAPLDVIVNWLPVLGRARASLQKIEALIPSLESRGESIVEGSAPLPFHGSIRMKGVTYSYGSEPDGDSFLLGPLDLTLRAGELVFLAGGNGSGKTTLVKLLSGLYRPDAGAIFLDHRPVEADDQEAYRQLFSVVFADGYLFQSLLGLDRLDLEERAQAGLERLGLGSRVRVENGAYSTVSLSHGQRRRLAYLTAFLEDRPILVFDEWAANQDPLLKKAFYLELLPELKAAGKTVLVVSHDEEYQRIADRVIRLSDGHVCAL